MFKNIGNKLGVGENLSIISIALVTTIFVSYNILLVNENKKIK